MVSFDVTYHFTNVPFDETTKSFQDEFILIKKLYQYTKYQYSEKRN